ncbi:MAG TPA: DUF6644 family protein [Burkholderiales bacterium]|nr:DUF6644 family protein [Burkholderiales bacterium]
MDIQELLSAFERSSLAEVMRHSLWMYPIVEIVHISGIAILVGAVVLFDLRLLGFSRTVSVRSLERHLLPWAWAAFLLIVPSGVSMLSAHTTEFAANPAFRVKLVLIAFAGLNAFVFHNGVYRSVSSWDQHQPTPAAAKASALLSLMIWFSVITCGRLIAYL